MPLASITWWGHDGESNGWRVVNELCPSIAIVVHREIGYTEISYSGGHVPREEVVHTQFATVRFSYV